MNWWGFFFFCKSSELFSCCIGLPVCTLRVVIYGQSCWGCSGLQNCGTVQKLHQGRLSEQLPGFVDKEHYGWMRTNSFYIWIDCFSFANSNVLVLTADSGFLTTLCIPQSHARSYKIRFKIITCSVGINLSLLFTGFSVDSAKGLISKSELTLVAGAPRASHRGAVVLLRKDSVYRLMPDHILWGEELASSFGYSVATADLNSDG